MDHIYELQKVLKELVIDLLIFLKQNFMMLSMGFVPFLKFEKYAFL
jgi:hypothetical protein